MRQKDISVAESSTQASASGVLSPVFVCESLVIKGWHPGITLDLQGADGRLFTFLECDTPQSDPAAASVFIDGLIVRNGAIPLTVQKETAFARLSYTNNLTEPGMFNSSKQWELGYGGAIFLRGVRLTLNEVRSPAVSV